MTAWESARKTAIIGWGVSDITRDSDRSLSELTKQACLGAIEDAGLKPADIDGLATYPDQPFRGAPSTDGIDLVTVDYLLNHIPLAPDITWYSQVSNGMIASAITEAVNALISGSCTYALVWRSMRKPSGEYGGWRGEVAVGDDQFSAPYGLTSIIQTHAVGYQRYLHKYKADPDAMAALTTNSRSNANLNPQAIFRDRKLTVEDYLAAPVVASPLRLFDCDVPVQGSAAIVLTTADRAVDRPHDPAYVLAHAQGTLPRRPIAHPVYMVMDHMSNGQSTAGKLWSRAGVGPKDVDVAELYDGFASSTYYWLEAAGFCGEGEASHFIQGGRISLTGELPVNTFGGSLSEGRLHGMGHVIEAARQVTGLADQRQVEDAHIAVALDGSPMLRNSGLVLGS
jgi:acetyl-CoA acetyltransferase